MFYPCETITMHERLYRRLYAGLILAILEMQTMNDTGLEQSSKERS